MIHRFTKGLNTKRVPAFTELWTRVSKLMLMVSTKHRIIHDSHLISYHK